MVCTGKLADEYVKLALIRQAICNKKKSNPIRRAVYRYIEDLVRNSWFGNNGPKFLQTLLNTHPRRWTKILKKNGVIKDDTDDVIPEAFLEVLPRLDYSKIYDALLEIPERRTKNFDDDILKVKNALKKSFRSSWKEALKTIELKLPLLIFDEAHHLKNDNIGNTALFGTKESQEIAEDAEKGSLSSVFDRMLFLTATPFQLGHHELCGVLRRFNGIKWRSIDSKKEDYIKKNRQPALCTG